MAIVKFLTAKRAVGGALAYIMNPDNIVAKKFVAAVWHMLNEKREINMFEKSFLDEMRRFYRDFSRGYAKYWETPLDILNA